MQLISKKVQNKHNIYLLSDVHFGLRVCHKEAFAETLELIRKDKKAYVVILGDLVEGRTFGHKFMDADVSDPTMLLPVNQYRAFKEAITPIKEKVLAILEGNHDRGLSRAYGSEVKHICEDLKIPYGTVTCKITLRDKDGKQLYKIHCQHGAGTIKSSAGDIIRREANMLESLKRKLKNKAADCIGHFMGHTHLLMVAKPRQRLYLISDDTKVQQVYSKRHGNSRIIPEDDRWYGNTGSFMKTSILGESTYAEEAGYDPIEMGYLIIRGNGDDIEAIDKVVV